MRARKAKKLIWEKQLTRFTTLFPWYLTNYSYKYRLANILGKGTITYHSILKNDIVSSHLAAGEFGELAEIFSRKAKSEKDFLDKLISNHAKYKNNFYKIAGEISRADLTKFSNKKLARILDKYCQAFLLYHPYPSLCRMFDLTLTADLERYLLEKVNNGGKVASYLSILASPIRLTNEIKNELGILKIAKKILQKKETYDFFSKKDVSTILVKLKKVDAVIEKEVDKHYKRFCWLPIFVDAPARTKDFYIEEIKGWLTDEDKLNEKYKTLGRHLVNIKKQKRKVVKELNPPTAIKKLIKYVETFAFIKTEVATVFSYTSFKVRPLFAEAASRAGWPVRDFRYLIPSEVKKFLTRKILPKRSLVKSRQRLSLICPKNGELVVLTGDKARQIIKEKGFLAKLSKEIKEIKGQIANLGRVRGRVKIIKSFKDIGKMKKGDILVAPITKSDLVMSLKKAVAIITDEGGLTCHAAIISRELGIPCIIGTKIATQVLKDGDLVEVDANKGIIKILK